MGGEEGKKKSRMREGESKRKGKRRRGGQGSRKRREELRRVYKQEGGSRG